MDPPERNDGTKYDTKSVVDKYFTRDNIILGVVLAAMLILRSVDYVLYIRMATKMKNYEYFLSTVLLSFGVVVFSLPVIWFKIYTGSITPEMRAFPQRKFAIMAILDTLSNLFSTIPASYVSGPVNVTLGQAVVPINLVISLIWLGVRYRWTHYVGVLIIMAGIAIDVTPLFQHDSTASSNLWLWIPILIASNIPAAMANVYKEHYLKEVNLDVWYLNGWEAIWRLIWGLAIVPVILIPWPSPAPYVPPSDIGGYMRDSILCVAGINSRPGDQCGYMWLIFFVVYLWFNCGYNVLMLVIFKRDSSNVGMIASAGRLALSNVGFLIPFIAGEVTKKSLSTYDIIALFVLIIGMIVYKLKKERKIEKVDEDNTQYLQPLLINVDSNT